MMRSPHALEHETSPFSAATALRIHFLCELRIFWRTPTSIVFIIALPLVLYAVFGFAFRNSDNALMLFDGVTVTTANRSYAGVLTFGLMSVGLANVGIGLALRRTGGIYRRLRTSAASPGIVFGAYLLSVATTALLVVLALTALGVGLFGVSISPSGVPKLLGSGLLAFGTFASLGTAISLLPRTAELAVPLLNAVFFPAAFLSGVFFDLPLGQVGDTVISLLPVRPLLSNFVDALGTNPAPVVLANTLVPLCWLVIGLLLSAWRFRWTAEADPIGVFPRRSARRR